MPALASLESSVTGETPANRPLRIAIFVQGRFHAFDLARALVERGHVVRLLTNYPKWITRRFGLPDAIVDTNTWHGVAAKLANWVQRFLPGINVSPALDRWFGTWAARKLRAGEYDILHGFSQVAEEALKTVNAPVRTIVRASAHIQTQMEILAQEQARLGTQVTLPSAWSIAREEREYEAADSITVLSTFAYETFVGQGVPPGRLNLVPLGVNTRQFGPSGTVLTERMKRILVGEPLRVLTVGTFSAQKGALDFFQIVSRLHPLGFRFRFVGAIQKEVAALARQLSDRVEFIPRQVETALPQQYAWGDLFLFPTLQDGFAVVLAQANAACLPVLTTTNSAGPDLIIEGRTGWVLPIRDPAALGERLRWCDENRLRLAGMVEDLGKHYRARDWNDVAIDFEIVMYQLMASRTRETA